MIAKGGLCNCSVTLGTVSIHSSIGNSSGKVTTKTPVFSLSIRSLVTRSHSEARGPVIPKLATAGAIPNKEIP